MYYRFPKNEHLYPDCRTVGDVWVYSKSRPPNQIHLTLEDDEIPLNVLESFKILSNGMSPHTIIQNRCDGEVVDINYRV